MSVPSADMICAQLSSVSDVNSKIGQRTSSQELGPAYNLQSAPASSGTLSVARSNSTQFLDVCFDIRRFLPLTLLKQTVRPVTFAAGKVHIKFDYLRIFVFELRAGTNQSCARRCNRKQTERERFCFVSVPDVRTSVRKQKRNKRNTNLFCF